MREYTSKEQVYIIFYEFFLASIFFLNRLFATLLIKCRRHEAVACTNS